MKKLFLYMTLFSISVHCSAQLIPTYSWAAKIGNSGYETSSEMVADSAGNVYILGQFDGTCDFDPGTGTYNLISSGWTSTFLAKYTSSGVFIWAKGIGGSSGTRGIALDLDAYGNIYIGGIFDGQVDMDPGLGTAMLSSNGLDDVFFAKYDSAGHYIWAKNIGDALWETTTDLKVDPNGFFYLTGNYGSDSLDLDPGTGIAMQMNTNFSNDPYVVKFDTAGNFIWGFGLEGVNDNSATCITLDTSANVIIGGYFSGTMTVDPVAGSTLTTISFSDCFLINYTSSGALNWAVSFGGAQYDYVNALSVSGSDIYATGNFQGLADFDPGPDTLYISSNGSTDAYIAKFNSTGDLRWAGNIGGTGDDNASYIHINPIGDIFIAGNFMDSADFNTGPGLAKLKSYGARDAFLAKYDSSGNYIWALKIGSSDWDDARGITYDNNSNEVWITGYYGNSSCYVDPMNVAPPLPTAFGGADIFLARYGECSYPVNTGQPVSVGVCPDDNANFSVNFSGNALSFQWQEGTNGGTTWTNIIDGGVYSGATTLSLSLSGLTTTFNNRFYRCIATESCGLSMTSGTGILFVTAVDTSVTVNQHILLANALPATYQWLDCNNGFNPIAGATTRQFIPSLPGNYAVAVTKNGCTDTSSCINVTTIGINEQIAGSDVRIFPVPATYFLNIELNSPAEYLVNLYDVSGRKMIPSSPVFRNVTSIDISGVENGSYLIGLQKNEEAEKFFTFLISR